MIVVLVLFIGYQSYRIALAPTPGLVALTVFDLLIVVLTWREYRRQRRARQRPATSPPNQAAKPPAAPREVR